MWNTATLDKGNTEPCSSAGVPVEDSNPNGLISNFQDRLSLTDCDMDSCIHYFICNNKKEFLVYFYTEADSRQYFQSYILSDIWKDDQHIQNLRNKTYFTHDPTTACFFVVLLDLTNFQKISKTSSRDIEKAIYSLPYWNNDGTNNIILFLTDSQQNQDFLWNVNTKKAIIAQTAFKKGQFRREFDILIPPVVTSELQPGTNRLRKNLWQEFPRLTPAFREYLISMLSYVDSSPGSANIETKENEFSNEFKLHFQIQRDLYNTIEGNTYLLKLDYGFECKNADCR